MPVYTYRREDGTTFDLRQKFLDEPLKIDPETGQPVVRVVQAASIIFKGSGFYVNDSKSASKKNISSPPATSNGEKTNGEKATSEKTGDAPKATEATAAPASTSEKTPTPAAAD